MSIEQKQRAYFMVNDFVFSLCQNKKINLTKYMDILQLFAKYNLCNFRLGDVSDIFFYYDIMIKYIFNLNHRQVRRI